MGSLLSLRSVATVMAMLVLAIATSACGGSDDEDGDDRPPAADRAPAEGSGDESSSSGARGKRGGGKKGDRDGGERAAGGGGTDGGGSKRGKRVVLSGDKEQARQAADVTDGVYDAVRAMERTGGDELVAGGGGELCDLMSEQARKQTVEYARRSSGRREQWDCELAVGLLIARSQRIGGFKRTLKAEVVGVNAVGDRATATIRFGKGPLTSVPLVREDGEWKLGASPATGGGQ